MDNATSFFILTQSLSEKVGQAERSAVPASSANFSVHPIAGAASLCSWIRPALLIDLRRWLGSEIQVPVGDMTAASCTAFDVLFTLRRSQDSVSRIVGQRQCCTNVDNQSFRR
ncbi:MAG: hypothetical protein ABGZ53_21650 [Fuerstiella sp.]